MPSIVEYFRTMPLAKMDLSTQVTVEAADTIREAVLAMAGAKTSCAFVMEDDSLAGIFTENDVAAKVAMHADLWEAPVSMVMTADPYRLKSDQTALDALRLMNAHQFRNLPVESETQLLGNLAQYDLIRCASDHLRDTPLDDRVATPAHALEFVNFLGIAPHAPVTLEPKDTLADAVQLMIEKRTGLINIPRSAGDGHRRIYRARSLHQDRLSSRSPRGRATGRLDDGRGGSNECPNLDR